MSEFPFEGGTRGGPNAMEHHADRQAGLLAHGAGWPIELPVESVPGGGVYGGIHVKRLRCFLEDGRTDVHGLGSVGFAGRVTGEAALGFDSLPWASTALEAEIRERWGGGEYELSLDRLVGGVQSYHVSVSGPSKPLKAEVEPEPLQSGPEIGVHATVWIELSGAGPFKVIAPYQHPSGGTVQARHPHDAPNCFEKVRVTEDLWLCQDSKGLTHILPAGSLTTTPPVSRLRPVLALALAAWERREVVLWLALAGMGVALGVR